MLFENNFWYCHKVLKIITKSNSQIESLITWKIYFRKLFLGNEKKVFYFAK